jgi:hypothetical protein
MTPCPACDEKRVHTPAEWAEFHEYAGHGYAAGVGWTRAELEPALPETLEGG